MCRDRIHCPLSGGINPVHDGVHLLRIIQEFHRVFTRGHPLRIGGFEGRYEIVIEVLEALLVLVRLAGDRAHFIVDRHLAFVIVELMRFDRGNTGLIRLFFQCVLGIEQFLDAALCQGTIGAHLNYILGSVDPVRRVWRGENSFQGSGIGRTILERI